MIRALQELNKLLKKIINFKINIPTLRGVSCMDYAVIEQKEILHEVLAGTLAEFADLADRNKNDEMFSCMYNKAIDLYHDIYGNINESMESIKKKKEEYFEIRKYLDKVDINAN